MREKEKGRKRDREGEIREREVKGIKRERVKGRGIERESERKKIGGREDFYFISS